MSQAVGGAVVRDNALPLLTTKLFAPRPRSDAGSRS
jgi:hypothetical protein